MTDPSESVPTSSGGVLDRSRAEGATLTASPSASPRTPLRPAAVEEVIVLDYGGQYSQLIARRIRDCGVFSEMLPHDVPLEEIARRKPRGIILSGGPASVYAPDAPRLERGLLELGVPVMGICYGMQLLMHELGGRVEEADVGEFGRSELHVSTPGVLLRETPREQTRRAGHLWNSVPSRGCAHPLRPGDPHQVPDGRMRL
jgi:GMP synthase (glutamine-hydrolysing)